MTETTVRNLRDGGYDPTNPDHVYIGRANPRRRLKASKWANPYPVESEDQRLPVITRYGEHLEMRPDLKAAIPELRGKVLWCWCHPKACHGHLLAGLANQVTP